MTELKQQLNEAISRLRQKEAQLSHRETQLDETQRRVENLTNQRVTDQRKIKEMEVSVFFFSLLKTAILLLVARSCFLTMYNKYIKIISLILLCLCMFSPLAQNAHFSLPPPLCVCAGACVCVYVFARACVCVCVCFDSFVFSGYLF